ncbi:MAG: amino acid ABC transporter substrate-binding protein [Rhodospirillales bacterium]|nr:amino acid ABC transporter substrate-binding protein [Rhodospirillales bacterium]
MLDGLNLSRRNMLRLGGSVGLGLGAAGLFAPHVARAAAPKLKTVKEGVITIAMSGTMPATGLINGKIAGSDAEMIAAIAAKLGLGVEPNMMAWSATVESIKTGRADIMCGDMGWTAPRAAAMLLTDAIYYDSHFITMKKSVASADLFDLADLKGHTIGTGQGFSYVPFLRQIPGIGEVKLYDTPDACIRDVLAGRVDYAMLDSMTVGYLIQQNPGIDLKQVPVKPSEQFVRLTSHSPIVMGMSLDNPDLFDAVNAGVKWMWRTKLNAKLLASNGMTSPAYLVPAEKDPRIGVDRDADGKPIGPAAHQVKDFSAYFA